MPIYTCIRKAQNVCVVHSVAVADFPAKRSSMYCKPQTLRPMLLYVCMHSTLMHFICVICKIHVLYVRSIALTTIYSGTLSSLARFAEAFIEIALARLWCTRETLPLTLSSVPICSNFNYAPNTLLPGSGCNDSFIYLYAENVCETHDKIESRYKANMLLNSMLKNKHTQKHEALWLGQQCVLVCCKLVQIVIGLRVESWAFGGTKLFACILEKAPLMTLSCCTLTLNTANELILNVAAILCSIYTDTVYYIESHCAMCVSDLCTISMDFMWGLNSVWYTRLQYITLCNKHHCGV